MTRDDSEDLTSLVEIVDALTKLIVKEAKTSMQRATLESIAQRARNLHRKRTGEED